ncbi:unnamed protein product [Pedinophyceae sp. YPF-701]|nr:unnamed protein product [Pedinophyceae sp. YPF-701]
MGVDRLQLVTVAAGAVAVGVSVLFRHGTRHAGRPGSAMVAPVASDHGKRDAMEASVLALPPHVPPAADAEHSQTELDTQRALPVAGHDERPGPHHAVAASVSRMSLGLVMEDVVKNMLALDEDSERERLAQEIAERAVALAVADLDDPAKQPGALESERASKVIGAFIEQGLNMW